MACSLLCRTFDSSLAEVCHEEGVGLLAYSPLAMGLLTVQPHVASITHTTSFNSIYYKGTSHPICAAEHHLASKPQWHFPHSISPVF